jgi:4-amino-4-deoxy-L-arabinose transferase-like glycosyltransferase
MCGAFSVVALRAELAPPRWRNWLSRWMDGVEAGWAVPLLLTGFVAVWLIFLMIAYVGGDLHSDVLETWTLGRSIEWGYSKHPPLMGWAARAWTIVFPLTNWSFQLLSLTNAAIGLWMVDLITRRFASGDKRLFVLLLLMLLPAYQFHAQRFNANAVLLPTWPLATYCFLRSFETRRADWAVAAGVAAALAMLGKYYSVFLLASFAVAALVHRERRAYFASVAPWMSAATCFAALVPHIHWLATTGARPFAYALERHTGKAFVPSLVEAALFVLAVAMLLAAPAAICAFVADGRLKSLRQIFFRQGFFQQVFRSMDGGLLLLSTIGIGTVVFPAVTAAGFGTDMPPIWALQGLFLFVILMVCSLRDRIPRAYSANLATAVIGIALFAAFVAAPIHAVYRNDHPLHEGRNFYRQAAGEMTRLWHAQSDAPLAAVGGDDGLAFALAFYSADHPVYDERIVHPHNEDLPAGVMIEGGWAALCYGEDIYCVQSMERTAARAQRFVRSDFVLQSTLLGQPGAIQRFTAFVVPPSPDKAIMPEPSSPGVAEDFSAIRRSHPY